MEKVKPYMIKFEEDGVIKNKIYSPDCAVKNKNR